MRELIPLEKVEVIDAPLRKKLAAFWITTVDELVSTARAGNTQYGSGRAALAVALGITEEALKPIISAANALLPPDVSFDVPVGQERGEGLFLDEYRDEDAASFAVTVNLPSKVDPLFVLPAPPNQGVRNTCVAFTLAAAYQILSKDTTDLSEQFLYWAFKSQDGIPGDVGTDPLKAVKILQTVGVCSEVAWPYKPGPSDSKNPGHGPPPDAAVAEAQRRRISGFQKLPATNVSAIKAVLAQGKPVLIGLRIWEHWGSSWQGNTRGRLRAPLPGERQRGGHAMCVVGYREDPTAPGQGYFIIRNSWGPDWAKENPDGPGYCHVPFKLVAEQGLAAIAIEGIATGASPAPTGGGGTVAGSSGAKLAGSAMPSLTEIYEEVQVIHKRLGELVDNLGALLAAEGGAAAPEPATPEPAALPEADQARKPVAHPKFDGVPSIILNRLSSDPNANKTELYPNGLSPEGKPLLRIDVTAAGKIARSKEGGEPKDRAVLYKAKNTAVNIKKLGTVADVNQSKIIEARWAVVINALEDAALIKAIWPLIVHRMDQMGHKAPEVEFRDGENAGAWVGRYTDGGKKSLKTNWGQIPPVLIYRPGERVNAWLARPPHNVGNGPVAPSRGVPFYLMLVGRPGPLTESDETFIPLSFQYELDIFWAVGRICFTDALGQHRLTDYTTFAERLVQLEQRKDAADRLRKTITIFATQHEDDKSTIRSSTELAVPLNSWSNDPANIPVRNGFANELYLGEKATRSTFERILKGDAGKPPALLFTASHGLGLPLSDERLSLHQGALVMGDWSGYGNVEREHWFAGEDLPADAQVEGSAAFLFACYGAGCPDRDEFIFDEEQGRPQIAHFPLIAQLPQQLLIRGAIGVIGHLERAWTFSFSNDQANAQSQPFEDVLGRLMQGRPLGDALDQFNAIQGARAHALIEELDNIKFHKQVEDFELVKLWMARNDARNYALLGDPAARLPYS
jgi:hypothetical protein